MQELPNLSLCLYPPSVRTSDAILGVDVALCAISDEINVYGIRPKEEDLFQAFSHLSKFLTSPCTTHRTPDQLVSSCHKITHALLAMATATGGMAVAMARIKMFALLASANAAPKMIPRGPSGKRSWEGATNGKYTHISLSHNRFLLFVPLDSVL